VYQRKKSDINSTLFEKNDEAFEENDQNYIYTLHKT